MSAPDNITISTDLYFEAMDALRLAHIYIDREGFEDSGGNPDKWFRRDLEIDAAYDSYRAYQKLMRVGESQLMEEGETLNLGPLVEKPLNCRVGCAVVIRRGDYVLLMQRAAHLASGGTWALAGGSVEDESATAGAAREIAEEVGLTEPIDLHPLDFWYDEDLDVKDGAPYVCVFFECEAPDGWEPTNMEPHKCDAIEWVKMCDVGFRDLMEGTEAAINVVYSAVLDNEYGTY